MAFTPRLTKPEAGNPYYNTTAKGGYSRCIVGQPTDAGCNVLSNCFAGETRYVTKEGLKDFISTCGTTQMVLNELGEFVPAEIKSFGVQRLYKVTFSKGYVFYATANHRWVVEHHSAWNGKKYFKRFIKTTEELTTRDYIPYNYYAGNGKMDEQGILHGIIYGDGRKNHNCNTYSIPLFGNKNELAKYIPSRVKSEYNLKEMPSIDMDEEYLRGFVAGLIATDGTITGDTYKVSSVHEDDMLKLRDICYRIGVPIGGIYSEVRNVKVGKYQYYDHRLFYLTFKRKGIDNLLLKESDRKKITAEKKNILFTRIKSIEPTDRVEEVYCAVEPKTHTITLEGNILTGQCVGYALGRFNEIIEQMQGKKGWKYHIAGNAEDFWKNRGNLFGGSTPEVGAIICWAKGVEGNSADGAGHVAVVEKVNADGSIITSESGWNSSAFWTKTRYKGDGNWGASAPYRFLGFIYNPAVKQPSAQNATSSTQTSSNTTAQTQVKKWDGKLPMLTVGSRSKAVKTLQILLNAAGSKYNCGDPDGQFGGMTRAALMKYQADFLGASEADGICGEKTWVSILGL